MKPRSAVLALLLPLCGCALGVRLRERRVTAQLQSADMLIARRDYAKAAEDLARALAPASGFLPPASDRARLRLKLAEIHNVRGEVGAAESAYRGALEDLAADRGPLRIRALSGLALLLHSQNRLDEALVRYEKAYALAKTVYGRGDARSLTLLRDIASLYRAKKDAGREEVVLREILADARASRSEEARADALEDLSGFLQARGRDAEALELLTEAVDLLDGRRSGTLQARRVRAARDALNRRLKLP